MAYLNGEWFENELVNPSGNGEINFKNGYASRRLVLAVNRVQDQTAENRLRNLSWYDFKNAYWQGLVDMPKEPSEKPETGAQRL